MSNLLPDPADTPCDFAILLNAAGFYYLTYEIQRDFLSTPRSFAVLQLAPGREGWVYLNETGSEDVEQGLQIYGEAPWHFVLCSGTFLLEVKVAELRNLGVVYQHLGAQQAMLDVLRRADDIKKPSGENSENSDNSHLPN